MKKILIAVTAIAALTFSNAGFCELKYSKIAKEVLSAKADKVKPSTSSVGSSEANEQAPMIVGSCRSGAC